MVLLASEIFDSNVIRGKHISQIYDGDDLW